MGNFHCIPEGCGRVVYQKYLPPVVRWRYPGEDWQELEADDYSIDDLAPKYDTEPAKFYDFTANAVVKYRVPPPESNLPAKLTAGQVITVFFIGQTLGAIYDLKLVVNDKNINALTTYTSQSGGNLFSAYCSKKTAEKTLYTRVGLGTVRVKSDAGKGSYNDPVIDLNVGLFNIQFTEYSDAPRTCIENIVDQCQFTIYKDNEIIYQSTRDVCPEVEQLPCRLDDVIKEIKIEKIPYLQRIEVRDQGIDYLPLPTPLLRPYPLSEECLNIYKTLVTAPPFLQDGVVLPDAFNIYQFVKQICSASGCPPPKYQVLCDCDCEKCPDGTCPVECSNHICCYDTSTGKAIKEIPIDKYCGSEN